MNAKGFKIALVALLLTWSSAAAFAAGAWDGTWGNGDPLIKISGHAIAYSFQGTSYPVSKVNMTPARLSFRAGEASVIMTATPDGKANFDFVLSGQRSNFPIGKQ
jgi:hypothetical protein